MEQRFMGLFPFERATGHFFYSKGGGLARLMADLKYNGFRGIGRSLGMQVGMELLATGFFSDIDMLVPVPMHFFKQAVRGYNQVEEICMGLESATGVKMCMALKAVRSHRTQTALTLEQRRSNTAGLFELVVGKEAVQGKHILLCDDVCTTGSTLTSAAEALLGCCPSVRVSLLTVGVTF